MKFGRTLFIIFLLFIPQGISTLEAQVLPKDSLYNEFRFFVKLVEGTHPDPYDGFGGKIAFHKEADSIMRSLKSLQLTKSAYKEILSSFLAKVGGRDSSLFLDDGPSSFPKYIYMDLKPVEDGVIISSLPTEFSDFLGCYIVSINGMSLDSLCTKISKLHPADNKYGQYRELSGLFQNGPLLNFMFPELAGQKAVPVRVLTHDGMEKEFLFDYTQGDNYHNAPKTEFPKWNTSTEYIHYEYVGEKKVMYLNIKRLESREYYLYLKETAPSSLKGLLNGFYMWVLNQQMPENIDEAIAGVPCLAEIFSKMLLTMKADNTENLIIDIRGNDGGKLEIALPTLYMLYGDVFLNTNLQPEIYTLMSPLHIKSNFAVSDIKELNERMGTNYKYGDYALLKQDVSTNMSSKQKQLEFVKTAIGNSGDYIKNLNGKPLYKPENVYVLTDALTYGSAFQYAFFLWKMGAKVVGIPSGWAPNRYHGLAVFELPYSKISGTISNSAEFFLPSTDKKAKIFWPDMMPEYKDYKKYNFDQDAEVLWLLDHINEK